VRAGGQGTSAEAAAGPPRAGLGRTRGRDGEAVCPRTGPEPTARSGTGPAWPTDPRTLTGPWRPGEHPCAGSWLPRPETGNLSPVPERRWIDRWQVVRQLTGSDRLGRVRA